MTKSVADKLLAEGNALMDKGYQALQTKFIKKAVQCYQKVLKSDPDSREALLKMGEGLAVLSKLKEALKLFDKAQKLFPDDYEVLWQRGRALHQNRKFGLAIRWYDKALALESGVARVWSSKGGAYFDRHKSYQDNLKAIECYDRALELDQNDKVIWFSRGKICSYTGGKEQEALRCFDRALELDPKYADALDQKDWTLRMMEPDDPEPPKKAPKKNKAKKRRSAKAEPIKASAAARKAFPKFLAELEKYAPSVHEFGKGATVKKIAGAEKKLGCKFPGSYRTFLREWNGADLAPSLMIYAIDRSPVAERLVESNQPKCRWPFLPDSQLMIAHNTPGDPVCLDLERVSGKEAIVVCWDHEGGDVVRTFKSLDGWLRYELKHAAELIDYDGEWL